MVYLHDGHWGAIEIKLGFKEFIDVAANNLLKFVQTVDTDEMSHYF